MSNIDWLGKPYYSLNAYFKHVYGQKIYKIAVDAGLSCPNRDGSLDTRGCIFCSKGGSGDFAVKLKDNYIKQDSVRTYKPAGECVEKKSLSVREQIELGKSRFNKELGNKFVIYFQAFTNTYGNIEYLRRIWTDALEEENVVGISVATRPDCLGEDVISLLKELQTRYCACDTAQQTDKESNICHNKAKFIWIELGLQTIHEATAGYIRRHYPLSEYEKAVRKLYNIGIPYITHIILGLPGEDREMMLETVRYVNKGVEAEEEKACSRSDVCMRDNCLSDRRMVGARITPMGIKLQLLHVLRDTDLAQDYEAGRFSVLEMDEYLDIVIECLANIDEDVIIHRVTGDGPKNILIAPLWSGNKKMVLNTLHRRMREQGIIQGELCKR